MTDSGFVERESRAAVDALVWRLKNRPEDDDNDELFAVEFITALKGHGWRPTLARPAPDWRSPRADSRLPSGENPGGADYLAKRAQIFARAAVPADAATEAETAEPP
jgi:hypothetical protein